MVILRIRDEHGNSPRLRHRANARIVHVISIPTVPHIMSANDTDNGTHKCASYRSKLPLNHQVPLPSCYAVEPSKALCEAGHFFQAPPGVGPHPMGFFHIDEAKRDRLTGPPVGEEI